MPLNKRATLGPLVSAVCLQQLRVYTEELAGRGPVLGAGRLRGRDVIRDQGLENSRPDDEKLLTVLQGVFGVDGTRLCIVTALESDDDDNYRVQLVEGACTFGAKTDEPMCVYTLGVFIGALQTVLGRTMQGVETECQAMGHATCTYEIRPHAALG